MKNHTLKALLLLSAYNCTFAPAPENDTARASLVQTSTTEVAVTNAIDLEPLRAALKENEGRWEPKHSDLCLTVLKEMKPTLSKNSYKNLNNEQIKNLFSKNLFWIDLAEVKNKMQDCADSYLRYAGRVFFKVFFKCSYFENLPEDFVTEAKECYHEFFLTELRKDLKNNDNAWETRHSEMVGRSDLIGSFLSVKCGYGILNRSKHYSGPPFIITINEIRVCLKDLADIYLVFAARIIESQEAIFNQSYYLDRNQDTLNSYKIYLEKHRQKEAALIQTEALASLMERRDTEALQAKREKKAQIEQKSLEYQNAMRSMQEENRIMLISLLSGIIDDENRIRRSLLEDEMDFRTIISIQKVEGSSILQLNAQKLLAEEEKLRAAEELNAQKLHAEQELNAQKLHTQKEKLRIEKERRQASESINAQKLRAEEEKLIAEQERRRADRAEYESKLAQANSRKSTIRGSGNKVFIIGNHPEIDVEGDDNAVAIFGHDADPRIMTSTFSRMIGQPQSRPQVPALPPAAVPFTGTSVETSREDSESAMNSARTQPANRGNYSVAHTLSDDDDDIPQNRPRGLASSWLTRERRPSTSQDQSKSGQVKPEEAQRATCPVEDLLTEQASDSAKNSTTSSVASSKK